METDRYFVFGNYIDEVLGFEWVFDDMPWGWFYFLHDHLYSPAALLDGWNGIMEHVESDAYGRREVMTPRFTSVPNGFGRHALIVAACSGCSPAEPYPCRDAESLRYKSGECSAAGELN